MTGQKKSDSNPKKVSLPSLLLNTLHIALKTLRHFFDVKAIMYLIWFYIPLRQKCEKVDEYNVNKVNEWYVNILRILRIKWKNKCVGNLVVMCGNAKKRASDGSTLPSQAYSALHLLLHCCFIFYTCVLYISYSTLHALQIVSTW